MYRLLGALALMFVCGSAHASGYQYDWSFDAVWFCGSGPGCGPIGNPEKMESGTFTVEDNTSLGLSGFLTPSDLQNITSYTPADADLFSVVNNGGLEFDAPASVSVCDNGLSDCPTDQGHFILRPVQVFGTASVIYSLDGPIAASVPEPATWVMMLIGFAGIGFAAKRSRHRNAATPTIAVDEVVQVHVTLLAAETGALLA